MYDRHDFPPEDLVDRIYEAPLAAAGWNTLIPHLESAFRGRVAIFSQSPASVVTLAACSPSTGEDTVEYESRFWRDDLAMRELRSAPVGHVVVDSCYEGLRGRGTSEFYEGYLRSSNMRRGIYASVHRDRSSVFVVSARRSASAGDFTDRDRSALTQLTRHFDRSFKTWKTLSRERRERAAALAAMSDSRGGLVLVDRRMTVHFVNDVGRDRLAAGPLRLADDILSFSSAADAAAVRRAIDACTSRAPSEGSRRVTLKGIADDSFTITMTSLETGAPFAPDVGRLALLTFDGSDPLKVDADAVKGLFGLTPSETRLLQALVTGERLSDYSSRVGVSITTARSHLNALFAKTDTRRQVDLVRRALAVCR